MGKGTILDAHNFLCQRYHRLNFKCISSCVFYYLPYKKLTQIAHNYPVLSTALNKAQSEAKVKDAYDLDFADY